MVDSLWFRTLLVYNAALCGLSGAKTYLRPETDWFYVFLVTGGLWMVLTLLTLLSPAHTEENK